MKVLFGIAILLTSSAACWAGSDTTASTPEESSQTDLVFREPFTLRLHVDKEHYYEQRIKQKIPFVANNRVYLFSGDSFGLKLGVTNGEVTTVTYQKDTAGADIRLEFKQEVDKDGEAMMMLVLKSNLKQVLYLDALMTVPEKKGVQRTSILPLKPGLKNFETWPHPIVQLVLKDLRLKEKTLDNAMEEIRRPADSSAAPQGER